MDVWSCGCIMGELLLRRPIFPGTDTKNQLDLICAMIGNPTTDDIERCPNAQAREKLRMLPNFGEPIFDQEFAGCNPQAVDLLRLMLTFDPSKRISIAQALNHPYLAMLHCDDDEPVTVPVSRYDFEFERM